MQLPPDAIRVMIVDDHPVYAEGLRAILGVQPDIELVGIATNGHDALRLAEELAPDVAIVDVSMPGVPGSEVARQLRERQPALQILALSGFTDEELVSGMIRAGAMSYILKDAGPDEIAQAVRGVHRGESVLTPSVAWKVLKEFTRLLGAADKPEKDYYDGLTPRELEVLRLVASAKSNREIAEELTISLRTVENHIHNIYHKLEIHDRTQAMIYAIRKGLVPLGG